MSPPRLARLLLALTLPAQERRFALADLAEEFEQRAAADGARQARGWYRKQVLRSVAPLLRRRFLERRARLGVGDPSRRPAWLPELGAGFRQALRAISDAPLVAVTALLSLGLGIGAATTVFTVANAMLLRSSIPGADIDRLAAIYTSQDFGDANGATSFPDYLSIVSQVRAAGDRSAIEDLMAYRMGVVTLADSGLERRLMVEIVTGNYFDVLGVPIARGRGFRPEETRIAAAQPVVVISDGLWRGQFGADPDVLGATLSIDGTPFRVIGVAPQGLTGRLLSLEVDAWLPLGIAGGTYHATPAELADRDDREYGVMARLRPRSSLRQAGAQLEQMAEALHAEHGPIWEDDLGRPRRLSVLSERDARVPPDARAGLFGFATFLLAITAMILLIACANVAGMFLARASERRQEMAIRVALGASRLRLVGMLMGESLLLGGASGGLGALLALQTSRWLEVMPFPLGLSLRFDFSLDARVVFFALVLSLVTTVAFGLAPALEASRPSQVGGLNTRRRLGLWNLLVVGQVAISLVFLVSAGLLLRALQVITTTDAGIEVSGIVSMTKFLPEGDYPGDAAADYFDRLQERLGALPGIEQVHTTLTAEMSMLASVYGLQVEVDSDEPAAGARTMIAYNGVTPGYMEMIGLDLLRGRTISHEDRRGAPRVAVVSDSFARRFWPGQDAVGETFRIVGRRGARNRMELPPQDVRVVGVVADGNYAGVGGRDTPYVWLPIAQDRSPARFVHLRARGGAAAGAALLRREVPTERGEVSLIPPTPYEDLIDLQYRIMSAASHALGYVGLFALLLATIGIYGVVAFSVSRRSHEMAVRGALGARPHQVMGLVVRDAMGLLAAGLLLGALLSLPIGALLAAEFAELSVLDPIAAGGAVATLVAAALTATLVPARRVLRVEPMSVLRRE